MAKKVPSCTSAVRLTIIDIDPPSKDQFDSVAVCRFGYINTGKADAQHECVADVYVELRQPSLVRGACSGTGE